MTPALPPTACCRKCGYAIVGIAANRCPECGAAFDPSRKYSFDRSPRARAWRRRWKPFVLTLSAVLLFYALAPRGVVSGTMTFRAGPGIDEQRLSIWRLAPPRWFASIPYPYWTERSRGQSTVSDNTGNAYFRLAIEQRRWFQSRDQWGSSKSDWNQGDPSGPTHPRTSEWADSQLRVLARAHCMGLTVMFTSVDGEIPQDLYGWSRHVWRFAPEEIRWLPP